MIHSVAPVDNQQGWGQRDVHSCGTDVREKSGLCTQSQNGAGKKAHHPGDFPREDYEANWEGRFTLEDLNIHGKRALGMDV